MMHSGILHLFVYGSLRSGFQHPAYEYISHYFDFVGPAKVRGKLVDMGTYPAGIPTAEDKYIIGELYRIRNESEFSWAFGQLDDYEGVAAEPDEEQLYRRAITDVMVDGNTVPAWIYWFSGDVTGKPLIPSGDMMQYLKEKK